MKLSKTIITLCLIALPIIGVLSPRAFGFIPAALGLIACIEYLIYYKKAPLINWPLLGFTIGFLILAGSSYFWAVEPDFVLKRILKLSILTIPSLFLLFVANSTPIIKKEYLKFLPYSLIIAAVLLLIETYFNYPLYRLIQGLPIETIVPASTTNWSLVIISILVWPTLYNAWGGNKILTASLFISVCAAILTATCESAVVALILGSIALLISINKPKAIIYTIGATVSIGIISSPWIAQLLFDTRPDILMNWTGASAAQRIELWDFVARKALESPWYGWGIESTRFIRDFDSAQLFFSTTNVLHPHNFALQLWIELGVLGAISGIIFVALSVRNIIKFNENKLPFIIAAFTAALVINLVGYGMWQGWLIGLQFMMVLMFITFNKHSKKIS